MAESVFREACSPVIFHRTSSRAAPAGDRWTPTKSLPAILEAETLASNLTTVGPTRSGPLWRIAEAFGATRDVGSPQSCGDRLRSLGSHSTSLSMAATATRTEQPD